MDEQTQTQIQEQPTPQYTIEDIENAIDNALTKHDDTEQLQSLELRMSEVRDAVKSGNESESDAEGTTDAVYTVVLDSGQVDTAKTYSRVLCTEGLILIIVMSLCAGLNVWQILQRGGFHRV